MNLKKYRWLYGLFISVGVIITGVGFWGYTSLLGSMPMYEGSLKGLGYSSVMTVGRDESGTAIITGSNRVDVSRALGFVHGQERYFQMDLLRRSAAGELAEIFGQDLLAFDKQRRLHQFRGRAKLLIDNLSELEKRNLEAYVTGVNQGLSLLNRDPLEYLLLGNSPTEWRREDSILVAFAMYFELQDSQGIIDISRGMMKRSLPENVYEYLTNHESPWDSLLAQGDHEYASFPPSEDFSYVREAKLANDWVELGERRLRGSNQWAVQFEHEGEKKAILASDMHLGLGVPNLWFRASLNYSHEGKPIKVTGVTLPGLPLIIMGSNSKVAWSYTNSQTDQGDVFIIDDVGGDRYLSDAGTHNYVREREVIHILDAPTEYLEIRKTPYGPVLPDKYFGKSVVYRWTAHHPESVNLNLLLMELSQGVNEAITTSRKIKLPTMNLVVADDEGGIGWTIVGAIPARRQGYSGHVPVELASIAVDNALNTLLDVDSYPTIINPTSGMLWTANNVTVRGTWSELLGDGAYINGSRAQQIHSRLVSLKNPTEEAMLAIQLDNEAVFLARWHKLLLRTLAKSSQWTAREEVMQALRDWDGHAATDSVAYYLVREFRMAARADIVSKLLSEPAAIWEHFDSVSFDYEEPVWLIIENQVSHLLDVGVSSWNEQLLNYLRNVVEPYVNKDGSVRIAEMQWGLHNQAAIKHPLSEALPFISAWLDAPSHAMAGDYHMPLVARPSVGASQRMVLSPGTEKQGIFHMPGGQSGHILSPFYLKGHDHWVEGVASQYLPGDLIYQMSLQ